MKSLELRIPPPVVMVLVGVLMWFAARSTPAFAVAFPGRTYLAIAWMLAGAAVAVAGVRRFRNAGTTLNPMRPDRVSAMVDSGIYRFTRNPMYLGDLLVLIGWAVWLSNALSLLLTAIFVLYMNRFQIAPEERALTERFGPAFLAYRSKVRRWL